jgi:hypothetical protein
MGVTVWDEHPASPSLRGFVLRIVVPPLSLPLPRRQHGCINSPTFKQLSRHVPIHSYTNFRNPIVKILAGREIGRVEVRGGIVARVRAPGCGAEGGDG